MKTSLSHLPEINQIELKEIADFIKEEIPQIQMVILFGSYARGDWVVDRYTENGTLYTYESDYDLLFVMKGEKVAKHKSTDRKYDKRIKNYLDIKTPLGIIYHGIDYLNSKIHDNSYFFIDLYNEGIMLYDNGEFKLKEPSPISAELRYEKSLNYYEKWFANSNVFLSHYRFSMTQTDIDKEFFSGAAFNLHQATERLFMTTCLIFTDYKPKTHDVLELYNHVKNLDSRFSDFFSLETDEEKRLFEVLREAYVKSRYDVNYEVAESDLKYLADRIVILKELTEKICSEKLGELKKMIDENK